MSEPTIFTVEQLTNYLKSTLSEKRFNHTIGVAETCDMILKHYNCRNFVKEWNGFTAGMFVGLIHDIAREYSNDRLLEYCQENKLELDEDQLKFPVLAHGLVSANVAKTLIGDYPQSWYRAVAIHTVGDKGMDNVALALFVADFTEPGRSFLSDERRQYYYSQKTLEECTYAVLVDMMNHWATKPDFQNAKASIRLKEDLESRIGK